MAISFGWRTICVPEFIFGTGFEVASGVPVIGASTYGFSPRGRVGIQAGRPMAILMISSQF
ncbi:hypothetical protein AB0F20_29235 [Streptomyces goshikiensis]|uniref:hypothetical protein n=1 Tax=Streptomyces goshikiensis TaxID=1942 RepID=UPI0033DEB8FB